MTFERPHYDYAREVFRDRFKDQELLDIYSDDPKILALTPLAWLIDEKGPQIAVRLRVAFILESVVALLEDDYGDNGIDFEYVIDVESMLYDIESTIYGATALITATGGGKDVVLSREIYTEKSLHDFQDPDFFDTEAESLYTTCWETLVDVYGDDLNSLEEEEPEEAFRDIPEQKKVDQEEMTLFDMLDTPKGSEGIKEELNSSEGLVNPKGQEEDTEDKVELTIEEEAEDGVLYT